MAEMKRRFKIERLEKRVVPSAVQCGFGGGSKHGGSKQGGSHHGGSKIKCGGSHVQCAPPPPPCGCADKGSHC